MLAEFHSLAPGWSDISKPVNEENLWNSSIMYYGRGTTRFNPWTFAILHTALAFSGKPLHIAIYSL